MVNIQTHHSAKVFSMRMPLLLKSFAQIMIVLMVALTGAIETKAQTPIGQNQSYEGLDQSQFDQLTQEEKPLWVQYWQQNQIQKVMLSKALTIADNVENLPPRPLSGSGAKDPNLPDPNLNPQQAKLVALSLISYQLPTGGWGKNRHWLVPNRQINQAYVVDTSLGKSDPNYNRDHGRYLGTIDNDATISEIHYISRLIAKLNSPESQPFIDSVIKGLDYLIMSQYPNGGFPQIYPLEGSYHDAITLNDNAMINALALLKAASAWGRSIWVHSQ